MSIPKSGVTYAHANSSQEKQIYMAAERIWGIKPNELSKKRFDDLKTVLMDNLTAQYGAYTVESIGNDLIGRVLIVSADPDVLKTKCSLHRCEITNAAFRCARCHKAMYCSRDHQRLDWSRHKVECISKR